MESSSSSKQANKASSNFSRCLVDGCITDLSLCRDYYRRHKVCETHSKTPKVNIRGREQRFCQQCSRFHSLMEFDQGKRSCRKRLDCHNRRRRKPQLESTHQNSTFFIANQPSSSGTTFISFGSTLVGPGQLKAENNISLYPQHMAFNNGLNHHHHNPLHLHESTITSRGFEMKLVSEGPNHQVIVSDDAPSLLSSNQSDRIEAIPSTHDAFDSFFRDTESFVCSAKYNAGMIEGSSSGASPQTLSFLWE